MRSFGGTPHIVEEGQVQGDSIAVLQPAQGSFTEAAAGSRFCRLVPGSPLPSAWLPMVTEVFAVL